MIDISISGLSKEFEVGRKILDGVTFQVDQGERVGLLGRNGAGKTTLFRILTGELDCDEGQVTIAPGKRLGLISQIPVYPPGYTVEDVLNTAFLRLREMEEELAALTAAMAEDHSPQVLERYDRLTAAFETLGGYDTDTRLNKVCNGLAISPDMRRQLFADLSGGEKTRINLGRLILEDTDILLLDEPTNHLDLRATEWLEEYLGRFKGTVLTISHDRYFLDRTVNRIIELVDGVPEFYSGNYSFYVEEKDRRYEERLRQYEKEKAEIDRLTETARKMHEHNTELLHKRAFSIEKRIERMRTVDRPRRERKLELRFGQREFHGDEALALRDLSKGFEGRTLFSGVELEVRDGERIALLGDNGTGKSTLLKIIMGEEEPDTGRVCQGPTVKLGYLPQIIHFDRPERNLVDTMLYAQNCSTQQARDRLAAFQFRGEDVFKPVSALSGGEQSRFRLCMLMDEKINFLILDEPTNHLDIAAREWIEDAVEAYDGNLLFVSHDRYFINKFAKRIWVVEQGGITDFRGTFEQYRAAVERRESLKHAAPPAPAPEKKPRPKVAGGTKELEKQVRAAERAVEKAEIRLDEIAQETEEAASDYLRLQDLYQEREKLEDELAHLYAQWEDLAARLEEARGNP